MSELQWRERRRGRRREEGGEEEEEEEGRNKGRKGLVPLGGGCSELPRGPPFGRRLNKLPPHPKQARMGLRASSDGSAVAHVGDNSQGPVHLRISDSAG